MRALSNYINDEIIINGTAITEAIKIGASAKNISVYTHQPKTKEELRDIVEERIKQEGPNCDLNDIDTSLITDMSELFYASEFNGDISNWNVSKVENMFAVFSWSEFNGDISKWDMRNVKDMACMFYRSKFNQDISNWDVSNVKNMFCVFFGSEFNQNISNWNISEDCQTADMFNDCPIKEEYKPKSLQEK